MKSEIRNPKSETNPKLEIRERRLYWRHAVFLFGIRISSFLRISDFELRNCFPHYA